MKTLLTLGLILSMACLIHANTPYLKYRNRLPQNCQNGLNMTTVAYANWFWNEQQCMVCTKESCYRCNAWNDCIGCADGTKLDFLVKGDTKKYCLDCTSTDIADCCFQDIDTTKGYSPSRSEWVHATRCKTPAPGEKNQWIIYGHVCVNIPSCEKYTQYGRCMKCFTGFYLTPEQRCVQCGPPAWSEDYVYTIQNEFELSIKKTSETVPTASQSDYCIQCFGERQCTKCGINWQTGANYKASRGSFLAENVFRNTFDKNIGRNPSFCIPCNPGCDCTGPEDLCKSCVSKATDQSNMWYKDPIKNQCFPCNQACVTSNDNDKINCCNRCVWDQYILGPRCIDCRTTFEESGHDGMMGVVSFDDWLKPNNNTEYKFKVCYRCDRINSFSGKNSFELPSWPLGENANSDTPNNKIQEIAKERLNRDVPSHPACTLCEAVTIFPTVIQTKADGSTTYTNDVTDDDWALRFITCTQCENGYELVFFGGNVDRQQMTTGLKLNGGDTTILTNQKFPNSQTKFAYEYRIQKNECRKCQELIRYQDRLWNTFNNTNTDETANRYRLVRRCERTSANSNSWLITQCGSRKDQEDYLAEAGDADQTKVYEATQRGPYLPYSSVGNVWGSIIKDYFQPDSSFVPSDRLSVGKLSWYLVPVDKTNVTKTCLRNKWQCLQIKKQTSFPITDAMEPRCDTCFFDYGYVMTNKQHCKKCDYFEAPEIKIGCNACSANPSKDDELQCDGCFNKIDGIASQNQNVIVWHINYHYNSTDRICTPCNEGCLDCASPLKVCNKCMTNWGRKLNSTTECLRCADINCLNCDDNTKVCKECRIGFRPVSLATGQTTTVAINEVYCESCEMGCVTCPNDRKTCTLCSQTGYYLEDGKCKIKRQGCINWEMNGGRCFRCQYGYKLNTNDGYCYKCFNTLSGFIDCPSQCSTGNFASSNVRYDRMTPVASITTNIAPGTVSNARILTLLDQEEN